MMTIYFIDIRTEQGMLAQFSKNYPNKYTEHVFLAEI